MNAMSPSPLGRSAKSTPSWLWPAYFATIVLLGAAIVHGAASSGYSWNWSRIPSYLFDPDSMQPGPLLSGLWVTIQRSAASFAATIFFGLAAALSSLFGGPVLRASARVYLELIRNTPLLVQIFIIYFVLGPVLVLDRFLSAVLAPGLFVRASPS